MSDVAEQIAVTEDREVGQMATVIDWFLRLEAEPWQVITIQSSSEQLQNGAFMRVNKTDYIYPARCSQFQWLNQWGITWAKVSHDEVLT